MESDTEFKNELIKKAKELIEIDKDAQVDSKSLIDKMFRENRIDKNSIDIVSCLLNYIKEKIFNHYLQYIFGVLEHNNFLTTLMEINKDKSINLDKNIIKILKSEFLKAIKVDDEKYEPKFLFNYKIPGFYNFYKNLSEYINKNISIDFYNNEKNLREYFGTNPEKIKNDFHDKEDSLLNLVLDKISQDKLYFEIIKKISPDLILNDYITFYLDKYIGYYSKNTNKIIELLIKLRFSEKNNQIIKNNESNPINIILIKIIWVESNVHYIKNILKVFAHANDIIKNDKVGLYKMVEDLIYDENIYIKYIVNPKRNPEHTREVNECFYILLASLCLNVTSEQIKLTKSMDESENLKNNEVEIIYYNDKLKEINNILQNLNDDLYIYLNELYTIDELIKIIDYQLSINSININNIKKIRKYLRESAIIIQKNQPDKIRELRANFKNLYNILQDEEKNEIYINKYFDTLKYIFIQEITKINDISYRVSILEELIKEKEIIKKSNDIFQILLKSYLKKEEFKKTKNNLLSGKDDIIKLIDQNLSDEQKNNYFSLSETLFYFFEKNSLIYLKNILKTETLDKEPMEIFKDCNVC